MVKKRYRTMYISDIHLGALGCKANLLLNFLKEHEAEKLYLVGDIVDGWRIKSKFYWPQEHTNVLRKFLGLSRKGVQIIWITGNHDEFLRSFSKYNLSFGNILITDEAEHVTADGKRLWVVHGDMFDGIIRNAKWLSHLGDNLYNFLIWINTHFNSVRKSMGLKYWSLSAFLKSKSKQAVKFIAEYEKALSTECKQKKMDGVVCGHIHCPEIRKMNGITYYNTGDWVESCTAIVEHFDGRMELIKWAVIGHDNFTNGQLTEEIEVEILELLKEEISKLENK